MRRIESHLMSKAECLRRAREYDWMAENSQTEVGAAYAFDRARLWRSLAQAVRREQAISESSITAEQNYT